MCNITYYLEALSSLILPITCVCVRERKRERMKERRGREGGGERGREGERERGREGERERGKDGESERAREQERGGREQERRRECVERVCGSKRVRCTSKRARERGVCMHTNARTSTCCFAGGGGDTLLLLLFHSRADSHARCTLEMLNLTPKPQILDPKP